MKSWTFYMVATSFGFTLLRLLWVAVTGDFTWAKHVGDITAMTTFAGWLLAEGTCGSGEPSLHWLTCRRLTSIPGSNYLGQARRFSVELSVKDKWL